MKELVVEKENELKRLDVFLVSNLNESRNFILKNIKNGNITVNDNIVKGGYSLKEGDIINVVCQCHGGFTRSSGGQVDRLIEQL